MILLASYPKSGNTWMRALLTAYLMDRDVIDLRDMLGPQILSNRAMFDDVMGVASSELPHHVVDRLRPAYFRHMAETQTQETLVKLHDRYDRTDLGEPFFPSHAAVRAIYVLRNPLNVVASFAQHQNTSLENRATEMMSDDAHLAGRPGFSYDLLRQSLGRWDDHVSSWVDAPEPDLLVLRYEDLLADTRTALTRVLDHIGQPVVPARVTRAVAAARFSTLQDQESDVGFPEKHPDAERFFDQGPGRNWRDDVPAELAQKLRTAFAAVMDRFGYEAGSS